MTDDWVPPARTPQDVPADEDLPPALAVLGDLDPTSDRAPFRQIADQLRVLTLTLAPGGLTEPISLVTSPACGVKTTARPRRASAGSLAPPWTASPPPTPTDPSRRTS